MKKSKKTPTLSRSVEWLSRLVQIPSVSPSQAGPRAGVPGEAKICKEVAKWFAQFGGKVYLENVSTGRPNIYGIWRGKSNRWFAVDVHLDTVGVEQMKGNPFSGQIKHERIHGRGAVDTKATLGVILALLEEMHQAKFKADANLLIAGTADEEHRTMGAFAFANWVRKQHISIDQLVVAEPTNCGPVIGHKGACRLEFNVHGISTHSSQPHLGKNAVTAAAKLVLALDKEHQRLSKQPKTILGSPTLTVTQINGGRGANVVPDFCSIVIDRRIVANEKTSNVTAGLRALAKRSCLLPITTKVLLEVNAFLQDSHTLWIKKLVKWSGQEPKVMPYGTNACVYGQLARECVILGPGSIDQAHGQEEWVAISQLEKLERIFSQWWKIPK